jgi:hypothetical protein
VADEEVPLLGGWVTAGVVRVGDTVRRPPGPNSALLREVLVFLERAGFDAGPRFLGYDERGRETLSFVEGDVPSDTRREERPVSIIDWDNVAPGLRVDDVGYAVWKHLNLGLLDLPLEEQRCRLAVFLDGYGMRPEGLLEAIRRGQRLLAEDGVERRWLAAHGVALVR